MNPSDAVLKTLGYSDNFDFPLTKYEVRLWCPLKITTRKLENSLKTLLAQKKIGHKGDYYFLPGRSSLIKTRKSREKYSRSKWAIARKVGEMLAKIPTIQMIAVTGSLAMNNSTPSDDIDLMIIVKPNTLWPTRLFVWLLLTLKNLRRSPLASETTQIRNKICDNLYLESKQMLIEHPSSYDIYLTHEILQALPIFDRDQTYNRFLNVNSWTSRLLPNHTHSRQRYPTPPTLPFSSFLFFLNLLFYIPQYLYMKPKMTNEKASLHAAFFHPNKPLDKGKPGFLK